MTLVDTNIILDILLDDKVWGLWSSRQVEIAAVAGPLVINDLIYAEVSVRYDTITALDQVLAVFDTRLDRIPRAALFLAAKAYRRYRNRGGTRTSVLSDCLIGAHAVIRGCTLLTRDAARYRCYFPKIRLISAD